MRCCLKSVFSGILLGILLVALLALGFYVYAYPKLDSILADAVRREYMLPPSAKIKFEHGTLMDTYQGKLESFMVEANEAKLEGLVINDVSLFATGIQFDMPRTMITGEAELKQVDHALLKFRVSEKSLDDFWSDNLAGRGITDLDVDLREKEIAVSGKVDLKITTVPVSARGVFETDGTQKIRMKVNELSFGGAKVGLGQFKELFSKSIRTPVLDLGDLRMGVNVKRLEPRNGYLYVEAESQDLAELAESMKKEPASKESTGEDGKAGTSDLGKVEDAVKGAGKKLEDIGGKLKDKIL